MDLVEKKQKLKELSAQREVLEAEAAIIAEELNGVGPNGEPPAGVKGPVVDKEGYPRADIDLYNVMAKRNRLACINTDHKILMKRIEELLISIYAEGSAAVEKDIQRSIPRKIDPVASVKGEILVPFAKINEILDTSPAHEAGLMDGDLLISFGTVNSLCTSPLSYIPDIVKQNVGKAIELVVKRGDTNINIQLTPRVWGGRGLLGLHLNELS